MCFRSLTAVAVELAASVSIHAVENEKKQPKTEPTQGSIVGILACSKCDFKATEKCQMALKLDAHKFVLVSGETGNDLFIARCNSKLFRVSGAVTLTNGLITVTGTNATELKNQVALTGKLFGSKCFRNPSMLTQRNCG